MSKIINGNAIEVINNMKNEHILFDVIITDPPYHLDSIVKRFGKKDSAKPKDYGKSGLFTRLSQNFIGNDWDGGNIAFDKNTWKNMYDVLKPGGFLLSFAADKNYHRMASAIEDAGFEIRRMIIWLKTHAVARCKKLEGEWEGWAADIKSSIEPICMARKPLEGTLKQNLDKHSVGAVNINDTSIVGEDRTRWPSNFIYEDDNELIDEMKQYSSNLPMYFYCPKLSRKERNGSKHPTIKPVKLMEYLIKMVTPKDGLILDPFCGTGSTILAAKNLGVNAIGIEQNKEYYEEALGKIKNV